MTVHNTTSVIVYIKDDRNRDIGVRPGTTKTINNGQEGTYDLVRLGPVIIFQKRE